MEKNFARVSTLVKQFNLLLSVRQYQCNISENVEESQFKNLLAMLANGKFFTREQFKKLL